MDGWKHKLLQNIHKLKLYVLTNEKVQIGLNISVLIILIIVGSLLISGGMFSKEGLVTYKAKTCYNKVEVGSENNPDIIYASRGEFLVVSYKFKQKCYKKMDFDYEVDENIVDLYISTNNIQEDCMCDNQITSEIGPLDPGIYMINIYKKADDVEYLVNSRNMTI